MIRRSSIALLGLVLGLLVWQVAIPPFASASTAALGGGVADLRPALALPSSPALSLGVLLAVGALVAAFCSLRLLRAGSLARVLVLGCAPALLLASGYLLITGGEPNRRGAPKTASPVGAPAPVLGTRPPARLGASPAATTFAGRLIYAADGRLWSLDPNGGSPVDLTPTRSRDTMAGDPALSPDGTTLAFTLLALPTLGQDGRATVAPGSDLYLLNLRSGEQRRVLEHDRPCAGRLLDPT